MKRLLVVPVALVAALAGAAVRRVQDQCGPFTDVSPLFCPYVLEAYYTGITAGTSPTTFSPDTPITRGQAAVFTTKALNQALSRGSRRGALGQWWTIGPGELFSISLPATPVRVASDGTDVWVVSGNSIVRVRASDGRTLDTWTGATNAWGVGIAMGRVFATAAQSPGVLYMIDPTQAGGPVAVAASNLGGGPIQIAFDGSRLWTANDTGSVSIVTPGATLPWSTMTLTAGFSAPNGIVFDGSGVWVSDSGSLLRLDSGGTVVQTVPIGTWSDQPVFDGTNIWVPTGYPDAKIVIVAAATGSVVNSLAVDGLAAPGFAAFDGRRMLIGHGDGLSVWDAASLRLLGTVPLSSGVTPSGVCSDGIDFWVGLAGAAQSIGRF